MCFHPFMQIMHIGDRVYDAAGPKYIGVFCKEGRRNDTGLVLAGLEMRIWK